MRYLSVVGASVHAGCILFTRFVATPVLLVVLGLGQAAQADVFIPASARVSGTVVGPGLEGFFYDRDDPAGTINSLAVADAIIASSAPSAAFNATSMDYPNGDQATLFLPTLGALLGADAASLNPPGAGASAASPMVMRLTGVIGITEAFDIDPNNSTIDVRFALGSDDGSRLRIGGRTLISIDGTGVFFDFPPEQLEVANFEAPGLYPVEIVWYDHFGGLGLEWYSSLPGGPDSGAPGGTAGIVPTAVLGVLEPFISCPEDPDAVLTRAVDPEGNDAALTADLPTHVTLQEAVDHAADGEVIGVYGRSTENVDIGGAKRLTLTQCTVAQLTAAAAAPVVDITSTGTITIIGLDTVGGTIGWHIGTDGHELQSVRATGASHFGILVTGHENRVSYNSVRGSAVGIRIDGDLNDLRGGTVENNAGDGVQVGPTATNNTFRTATVQTNRGHGILVAGSGNTIRDNGRVNRNALHGLLVTGSHNTLRSNRADENAQDGLHISGASNTLQDNKANKNGGDGFDISGAGNTLKGNASNQGASGGSNENRGAEYNVGATAINQGGNKADNIGVPKTTAPVKCPTFPAAGPCE